MARLREFDTEEALEKAMNIFWEHGYLGASVETLLAGMGLSRGSLYKAFKSKKQLFLRVLERYREKHVEPAAAFLMGEDRHNEDRTGADRIDALFSSLIASINGGDRRGCLLCNTATDAAFADIDIQREANEMLDILARAFHAALLDQPSHPPDGATLEAEAYNLVLQYVGVRVLTRGGREIGWLNKGISAIRAKPPAMVPNQSRCC